MRKIRRHLARYTWLFRSEGTEEPFYVDYPATHAGFVEYRGKRGARRLATAPIISVNGIEFEGERIRRPQGDGQFCTWSCQHAITPEEYCMCPCHGKNHGLANRGLAETAQPINLDSDRGDGRHR